MQDVAQGDGAARIGFRRRDGGKPVDVERLVEWRIVSGSWDESVRLWSVATAEALAVLREPQEAVYSLAVSPDGRRFATGSWNAVTLWDAERGAPLERLGGFRQQVTGFAFDPGGTRLAVTSRTGILSVVDLASGERLDASGGLQAFHGDVAWAPDGRSVVVAANDLVAVFDVTAGLELTEKRPSRRGTVEAARGRPIPTAWWTWTISWR